MYRLTVFIMIQKAICSNLNIIYLLSGLAIIATSEVWLAKSDFV